MNTQEIVSSIALTKLNGLSLLNARTLLDSLGSASEVFAHRKDIVGVIPDASKRLVAAFDHTDEALRLAEEEMKFVEQKRLRVLTLNDVDYPQRLRECEDAPLVLYYCGSANLNSRHIVSIVGTRKCSEYGREVCNNFIADLKRYSPDMLNRWLCPSCSTRQWHVNHRGVGTWIGHHLSFDAQADCCGYGASARGIVDGIRRSHHT